MAAERLAAEVAVVGAGPAGVAAAAHAAEAGARVVLLDEAPQPGGQIWRSRGAAAAAAAPWLERLSRGGVTLVGGAAVVDAPNARELLVDRGGDALVVEFDRLVLAAGARELLLPFPGWTLPGVVGAGGAQALLKAGASFDGLRVVVAGTGPLLPAVAAALRANGARVVAIVEQAPLARLAAFAAGLGGRPRKLGEALGYGARLLGVPYRTGAWVKEARGNGQVERVVVTDGRRESEWRCDALACGFSLVANLELPRLVGCDTADGRVVVDERQQTSRPGVFAAGELVAIGGVDHALVTGAIAGLAAAGRPVPEPLAGARAREAAFASRIARAFALRDELRALAAPDTVVCRCEDVTAGAIDESAGVSAEDLDASGPDASRRAKLHTRAGMGACQGRTCGAALGFLRGAPAFTIRPPLVPAPLSVLAGYREPDAPARTADAAGQEEEP